MTKDKVIKDLIEQVDYNIFKNELVIEYKESGNQSDADVEKTKEIIEKDKEYKKFLENALQNCN